jgi:hypothetical protein
MSSSHTSTGVLHRVAGYFGDAFILLALVCLLPLVIVVIGAPVALLARLLLEITQRL